MKDFYPLYLANVANDGKNDLAVTDKFTQDTVSCVARADADMLDDAIVAGVDALPAMQALYPYQKQEILRQCVEQIRERFDELVDALIIEGGKPKTAAIAEVTRLINTFELTADAVTTLDDGDVVKMAVTKAAAGYRGMTKRVPIGLCAFITPFNFPLNLVAHKIAPAIAAGCPFILKPASATPISALILAEILSQTNLPKGAFSVLPMSSDQADALVEDERIKLLSFTGSDQVGWDMKQRAGKKKVVLELGGNAAVMLEPDCDLDVALPRIITGAYNQAGQVCISVQRVLVHQDIHDEVQRRLLDLAKAVKAGNPQDQDTLVGPIISDKELSRIKDWLTDASQKGAKVLCGGHASEQVMEATLLCDVPHTAKLYKDEAFAPIMLIESYDNFGDGLKLVNDSRFGLQVGIYTNDINKAMQAWDSIEAGGIMINDIPTFRVDNMPYGGVKDSGLGREGIKYAIEDMSEIRLLVIKDPAKS